MGISFGSKRQILEKGQKFKQDLYEKVRKFREKYQNQFDKISPKIKQTVIMLSALQLVELLQLKKVTSYQIVLIFSERTSVIGIQNNYVFQEMFQQALQKAKQCDKLIAQNPGKKHWKGDPLDKQTCFPPFFGIPASYKQLIRLKGKVTHVGFIIPHQKNYPPQQDGLFAELTIRMGFIPFVRTNVPMSCKTIETNNNMFGYCKNPWNQERSCGGSSGGQGGLIGAYCSPIGFGTDIGGSLRIPSQWNGLTTLKPAARYSRLGNCFFGKISGGTAVKSDLAPITRSVDDIVLFMKFMCDQTNYTGINKLIMDPYLNLKPFSSQLVAKKPKLKIGYITNLQTITCSPSHARIVKTVVDILTNQGHQMKQIKMPVYEQLHFAMMQMYLADGSMAILQQVSFNEPVTQEFKLLQISTKFPNFIKTFASWMIRNRQPRMARILDNGKALSVSDTFAKIYELTTQLNAQIYKYFIQNQIDALVMPGFAFPSPKLGTVNKLQYCFSYTLGWNVVNYPAGIVPVSLVQQDQQHFQDRFNDSITKKTQQNLKDSVGMPVGVQVVSLPFKEEIITYLMSIIQEKVQFRKNYPCKNILKRKV